MNYKAFQSPWNHTHIKYSTEILLRTPTIISYTLFQVKNFKTLRNYSFLIISPGNWIRKKCIWLTQQKWFDYTILFLIALNCIALMMERPAIQPNSTERKILQCANYSFTIIFFVEMIIKIIAFTFILGPQAYIKSSWNILDGSLAIIGMISMAFDLYYISAASTASMPKVLVIVKVLRLLRTLRPLRMVKQLPGLQLVIETLISSLGAIGNVALICLMFLIIFGILGIQLFRGQMHYCEGPMLTNVTTRADCEYYTGNRWVNNIFNFDHLGNVS